MKPSRRQAGDEAPRCTTPAAAAAGRVTTPAYRSGRAAAVFIGAAVVLVAVACGRGDPTSTTPPTSGQRPDAVKPALDTLRSAFEAGTPGPILATFTDDVQLNSPALIGPEYRGRQVVGSIVTPAMQVLEDVRVSDMVETGDGATGGVVFDARVGDLPAQGVVLLRARGDKVSEITLLLRPLPALRAFVTRMGELGARPALDAGKG